MSKDKLPQKLHTSQTSRPYVEEQRQRKSKLLKKKVRSILFVIFLSLLLRQPLTAIRYYSNPIELSWDAASHAVTPTATAIDISDQTKAFSDNTVGNATNKRFERTSDVASKLTRGELNVKEEPLVNNQTKQTTGKNSVSTSGRPQLSVLSLANRSHSDRSTSPSQDKAGYRSEEATIFSSNKNATQAPAIIPNDSVMSNTSLPNNQLKQNTKMTTKATNMQNFDKALERTTRILYQDGNPLDFAYWLSQPAPRVFIYDTLPEDWSSISNISSCVDQTFGITTMVEKSSSPSGNFIVHKDWHNNCRWSPSVCTDTRPGQTEKHQRFLSYRYNYNSDISYLKRFYDYPYRTDDPEQADLFLVPYPHKSHCLCHKDFSILSAKCNLTPLQIQDNVLNRLTYYNSRKNHTIGSVGSLLTKEDDTRTERHLFLFGADWNNQQLVLTLATRNSMTLSLGPSPSIGQHWSAPYVSTGPDLQPNVLFEERPEEFWTTRERPYMVGAAFGLGKRLPERQDFVQNWKEYLGGTHMEGKQHVIKSMTSTRVVKKRVGDDIMELYRNSTFCLILPGDGCAQKRFFDVVLNGCIPVVALFEAHVTESGFLSLVAPRCSVHSTYPFAKGTFYDSTETGVNILDLVVTYNGTCGFPCLKEPLETILRDPKAVQEKRLRLRGYAALITFGLSEESYEYPDAFMATIVSLRHRLWHILGKLGNSTKALLES